MAWAGRTYAQEFRATIVGRVTDPSGAAIIGAQVRATNVETNLSTRAVTGATGDYVVPFLPPGRYRVEIEHPGFRKYQRDGVVLQVQDRPTLDVSLEVGDIATSVTVSSDASPLETATASRGEVIAERTLTAMPLNGRNVFMLTMLTPGVTFTARGSANSFIRTTSNGGMTAISISGGAPSFNEALLDGVSITGSNGEIQFVPSVEAAQEYKVQGNSFDAEFGRFTGGIINATTKSGTNELHGVLYEFLRNSAFNARDTFATSIPQFGYNLFGGSVGGPVYVPKVYNGRNRTFFFFNYEGSREGVPRTNVLTVPTVEQRRADFSRTFVRQPNGQAALVTIYDPGSTRQSGTSYVRDPFAGNQIPASRLDRVAAKLMELYPQPNAPGDSITAGGNWLAAYKDPVLDDGYLIRIDHRFSDRHQVFGRYSFRHFFVGSNPNYYTWTKGVQNNRYAPGFALDDTYMVGPSTVLNFRYGISRWSQNNPANLLGYDMLKLGFPASFVSTTDVRSVPVMNISGYDTLSRSPLARSAEDTHTLRGGLTKILGRHSVRTGADFRLMRSNDASPASDAAGSFTFNNGFTRGPNPQATSITAGSSLASFLLGLPASGSASLSAKPADQGTYYGLYVQDDFRASSRLTLNLGLRYEWEGAYTERYNRLNRGFDFTTDSPIAAPARANYGAAPIPEVTPAQFQVKGGLLFAGVNSQPRALTNRDRNNIAPRIGVAYSVTRKTVLRAGYGMFFGATTLLSETRNGFSISTPFVSSIDGGLTPVNTLSNPFPDGLIAPSGAKLGLMTLVGQSVSFVNPDRQQPLAHQYQFGIQRELPGSVLVDAAYSGSASRDIAVNRQVDAVPDQYRAAARETFLSTGRNMLNDSFSNPFYGLIATGTLAARTVTRSQLLRPYPQFTGISNQNRSVGETRYDSFQLKVTKRMSQGVSMLVSYTSSKLLERSSYLNETDPQTVKELATFDVPQRLVASGIYELPLGPGKHFLGSARGLGAKLTEGFQLNVIYTANGGIPMRISGAESTGRSPKLPNDQRIVSRWFDTSVFRVRQTLELVGTSMLPDVRSGGRNNFDVSIFKTTTLAERLKLQFRAESFNTTNRPEYNSPDMTFGGPNFGKVTSTNIFARQFQFGLRLLW